MTAKGPYGMHIESVVATWLAHWPLVLEVIGLIFVAGEEKFQCLNMLSLVSFAGMTLNKCGGSGH